MIGVAVLGFGVMGRVHAAAWHAVSADLPVRLVGVHSRSLGRARAEGNLDALAGDLPFDASRLTVYEHIDDLLADESIHAVSICTHTDSHAPLALRALEAGKHVLVEKPVALSGAEVEPLVAAEQRSGRLCMPALCMRFWPGWPWLREHVNAGTFGAVRSARFERAGPPPTWAPHFYGDLERSGGALHDLHVHDADFVLWTFGDPHTVTARGDLRHVDARYHYDGRAEVSALGAWIDAPFRMTYRVAFEDAVADFRHDREPAVWLERDGATSPVPLPVESAYDAEVRHFARAILGEVAPEVKAVDALAVARLLDREKEALKAS